MSKAGVFSRAASPVGPATILKSVAPDDARDLAEGVTRSIYVGGGGTVTVADAFNNVATLVSGAGQYHPIRVKRILATGTSATGIIALY